jgi:two-component system response regulator FixJ
MQFEALCQFDIDAARVETFDRIVRAGPWALATLDGLFARNPMPFAAVLVHDVGQALNFTLTRLGHERNQLAVVAYRETIDPGRIVDTLHAGAIDYLTWPLDPDTLPDRLQITAARAKKRMHNTQRKLVADRGLSVLSKREREVLDAVAAGNSNKAIAHQLGISPRTIEIHRANMMGKLGVKHIAEAVAVALRADLISESRD